MAVNNNMTFSFSGTIKNARRKMGLSQTAAATRWGFKTETIRAWEQGKRNPSGLYRAKLEKVLKKVGA